jgi:TonB dependent receptor
VRRAYNLRVPSDAHRSGELTFSSERTRGPQGGGLALATFLLGDVTRIRRYVSTSTDARERQWRHFYYGQDTWKVTSKLTVNYGLRFDIINPQTLNEPGNGGFLDLNTGEIRVAGIGDIPLNGGVENSINLAPRLGIAYQINSKTVVRAGYGRSYDIGVFGSVFGHSVTQNLPVLSVQELNSPANFERVFTLAQGPPAPVFPAVGSNGRFRLPDGVFARALPEKQRLPSVDAYNVTGQYQLTDSMSAEVGYVGNKGTHVFAGNGPAFNTNQPSLVGYPAVPLNNRRPFFGRFGWTQGIDYFCNCADNRYDALQAKVNKRFGSGYSMLANYTWSRARGDDGDYFIHDQDLNRGPQDWNRTSVFILSNVIELPFGKNKRFGSGASRALDLIIGGWQFNHNTNISSGLPFNVSYRNSGADRDAGPNRPNVSGDVEIFGGQDRYFDTTPIGTSGSAFSRPASGTFGTLRRNALRGPGFWNTDASLFKKFTITERTHLEFRVEARNLWNHVNLGLPDGEVGVPGNDNPNAGRITSTFPTFNPDTMRIFQFALKLSF